MSAEALAPTRVRKQQSKQTTKATWTLEEDELLTHLVTQSHTNSWSALAKYFPSKTAPQIAGRWEKVLNPNLVKGSWTREEDQVILNFVQQNGDKDWAKLALMLNGRTGKQCRERFKNHLDPNVMRNPWTPEEDQRLIDLHAQFGNAWTKISNFFDGRTDNCIKNRWNSTIKKRLERLEKGEPLVMKRGRKPKGYYQSQQENEKFEILPSSSCSSPLRPSYQKRNEPLIELVHFDQFAPMIARRSNATVGLASLEQNRLDFQRMLSAIA